MLAGSSTISGTVSAYAGGSIQAIFQPQGGGAPLYPRNSTPIAADGTFSLVGWNNANALYAPSETVFIIQCKSTQYSASVSISGTSQDISSAFTDAPTPVC